MPETAQQLPAEPGVEAVSVAQNGFRVRTDATAVQGGTPVWTAAQSVNGVPVPANVPFRIRFCLYNSGTTASGNNNWVIYVSKNGGAYQSPNSIPEVVFVDATNGASPNGQLITTSLLTSAGTFASGVGGYQYNGNSWGNTVLAAGRYMELEFGIQLNSPACDGNTYSFQFQAAGLAAWPATPSFTMAIGAALAVTEANDVVTGHGSVPNFAHLAATEANDGVTGAAKATLPGTLAVTEASDVLTGFIPTVLTGSLVATEAPDGLTGVALGGAEGALAATEAPDVLTGVGVVAALGAISGRLAITEANDALSGLGTVAGFIASLSALEGDDILFGAASSPQGGVLSIVEDGDIVVSRTMLGVGQWLPIPPPRGVWVQDKGCN